MRRLFTALLLLNVLMMSCAHKETKKKDVQYFYVGTYTSGDSEGIYRYALNPETEQLENHGLATPSNNPSFMALSDDEHFMVAVHEIGDKETGRTGYIESFAILSDGKLKSLSKVNCGGAHPCHVAVNKQGYVLAANYTGGNVALMKMDTEGMMNGMLDLQQHEGSGPNVKRQESPHAHSTYFEPNGSRIFSVDLGIDKVKVYTLNESNNKLEKASTDEIVLAPGAGPRHMCFHPNGKLMYVINELGNTVSVVEKLADGSFNVVKSVNTLPEDFSDESYTADIHVTSDGKFLYGSNRGHNSIAIFKLDEMGIPTLIGCESTRGDFPRNFTLSPDEDYLLAANQHTSNIILYKRDAETGLLEFKHEIAAPNPVCLLFKK
ncbi:lactonase family protein [Puteibacter caeruleilacunae]|nr:lactonase family protein [Puteibacter caeruleilacunae]